MQQAILTAKKPVCSKVYIPGSKEISQRAIIMAAIADGVSEVSNLHLDEDIKALINTLHHFGIVTQIDPADSSCIIAGGNKQFPRQQTNVWCDSSATNAIFLLAICATTPGVYYFDGSAELHQYDIEDLLLLLKSQGAQFTPSDSSSIPFTMIGTESLEGGRIIVDESVDGEQLSCLLVSAPYSYDPLTIILGQATNQKSVELTSAMMTEFGVLVQQVEDGEFTIPVPQHYTARDYQVEPDFGYASYFFAAAAVTGGEIAIQPVNRLTAKQSDIKFLTILEKMGCEVLETEAGLTVKGPPKLKGVEVSLDSFSDMFAALIAIAPFADQPTRIHHIGEISKVEQQRITNLKNGLFNLGITMETGSDWVRIIPAHVNGGAVNINNDRYTGMALALIGLKVPDIIIDNAESINKDFPNFFNEWKTIATEANINV